MLEELTKNAWHIPILMGMVLVYALLLNWVLFRPVTKLLEGRKERSREAASLADSSKEQLERRFAEYEEAVLDARRRGARVKEEARAQVAAKREEMLEAVRAELRAESAKAEGELEGDVSKARAAIEATAPELARAAVQKILGRGSKP